MPLEKQLKSYHGKTVEIVLNSKTTVYYPH